MSTRLGSLLSSVVGHQFRWFKSGARNHLQANRLVDFHLCRTFTHGDDSSCRARRGVQAWRRESHRRRGHQPSAWAQSLGRTGVTPGRHPAHRAPRRAHRLRLRPGRPPVTRSRSSSSVILSDTEDTWKTLFGQMGGEYHPPRLVLFRGAVDSACGLASSAVGPFYCSADSHVYLDRSFFEALAQRFGAPGEFARAYVIAHEIGITFKSSWGSRRRWGSSGPARARRGATRSPFASSSKPTASPGSGVTSPGSGICSSRAMWNPGSRPRPPSATIASNGSHRATLRPSPSPTAPRPSACAGSAPGSTPATCASATPS